MGHRRHLGRGRRRDGRPQLSSGAQAIISTITSTNTLAALLRGLAPQGKLVLLGAGKDPLSVSTGQLVGGERGITGSLTGTPHECEKTLDFSLLTGVRPRIDTLPLSAANQAYAKMKSGEAKFRLILYMNGACARLIAISNVCNRHDETFIYIKEVRIKDCCAVYDLVSNAHTDCEFRC